MKRIKLSNPPDPAQFSNQVAWQRATYDWMQKAKSVIEIASNQNDTPLQQNFVVSSYSTNTALTGTSTGTDLANFLCSLVQSMTDKGFITVKTSTGN